MKKNRTLEVWIPKEYDWVLEKAKERARRETRSVSNLILRALIDYLGDDQTPRRNETPNGA